MRTRLIQFQTTSRGGWLGPVLVLLAGLGAAVVLLVTAFLGVIVLSVGGVLRLLTGGFGHPGERGRISLPSFLAGIAKKLFGLQARSAANRGSRSSSGGAPPRDARTISLDRDDDGVWRP